MTKETRDVTSRANDCSLSSRWLSNDASAVFSPPSRNAGRGFMFTLLYAVDSPVTGVYVVC